ncbi:hypothetical protein TrispH2_011276 [Trichoplax sp. H2]|nr:hypothetical protein TrispH2_011276 [Trichoplax sp. H2]|eukprot:RDD37257.1 hypothetical protein TrispH2_011276 [Trichoplax sp. H2]
MLAIIAACYILATWPMSVTLISNGQTLLANVGNEMDSTTVRYWLAIADIGQALRSLKISNQQLLYQYRIENLIHFSSTAINTAINQIPYHKPITY